MKVFMDKSDPITRGSVCTIGSFDGVHRGHQEIVRRLRQIAGLNKPIGIITFIPLPFFVLTCTPIVYLTLKEEKERLFRNLGVDFIYYFRFDKNFSRLTPDRFIKRVQNKVSPSVIVIGDNFHFGRDRAGSATLLRLLARGRFDLEILRRVKDDGTISSTRIRELLLLGHLEAANKLLGRPYSISGRVVKGSGKGTKLGFPTINIRVSAEKLLPLDGVYRVQVILGSMTYAGAMFCRYDLVEVHIIDFSGFLYRKKVIVNVHERIRNNEHFADDEQLKAAIARDINYVRKS